MESTAEHAWAPFSYCFFIVAILLSPTLYEEIPLNQNRIHKSNSQMENLFVWFYSIKSIENLILRLQTYLTASAGISRDFSNPLIYSASLAGGKLVQSSKFKPLPVSLHSVLELSKQLHIVESTNRRQNEIFHSKSSFRILISNLQ